MTTGNLVLNRLHKKADLIETNVNCTRDRKVGAAVWAKLSFDLGKKAPVT